MTFILNALAISPVRLPIRPKPMIPMVLPASSISGVFQKLKSRQRVHSPDFTAWSCRPT